MRIIMSFIVAACLAAAAAKGDAQQTVAEQYSALPGVWDASMSPSGRYVAAGCAPRGLFEVCIYDLSGQDSIRLVQEIEGSRIIGFEWASDDYLLYWISAFRAEHRAIGRSEHTSHRIFSYSIATGASAMMMRQVTNITGASELPSLLTSDPGKIAMELTVERDDRPQTGSRLSGRPNVRSIVYEVELETGDLGAILQTSFSEVERYVLDAEGALLAEARYDFDRGEYSIWSNATGQLRRVFQADLPTGPASILGTSVDGDHLVVALPGQGLQHMALQDGTFSEIEVDGRAMDQAGPVIDRQRNEVVGYNIGGGQVFTDRVLASWSAQLADILAEEDYRIIAWSSDRRKLVIEARDAGVPAVYYLLDIDAGSLNVLDYEFGGDAAVPSRQYLTYNASDGLEIGAWLTLPVGVSSETESLPLVVLPHGGPASYDSRDFDWWSAAYAAMGYAVLQPNFRGSLGYGQAFQEAGFGGFGERMIDDIIDGAHHLQTQGIAQPGAYCVVGGSYGGYAAFMMALRDPEGVGCLVSFAGVTDPFAFLGEVHSSAAVRYWEQYMGSRFANREGRETITPVDRASELELPMLVLHGDQDTVVPISQMESLRRAMRGRETARFETLEGQSHFFDTAQMRERMLTESGGFLLEYLPVD